MADNDVPVETRKRARATPVKQRYAARYAELRQRVDFALIVLRRLKATEKDDAGGLVALAVEVLEGE